MNYNIIIIPGVYVYAYTHYKLRTYNIVLYETVVVGVS